MENKPTIENAPEWLVELATQKRETKAAASAAAAVRLSTVTDEQLADLKSALAHPALLQAASTYQPWAEVGLALLTLGERGRHLWIEFSGRAPDPNPKESAEEWWEKNRNTTPLADYRHIFVMASNLKWKNPGVRPALVSTAADFPSSDAEIAVSEKLSRFKPIPVD